VAPGDIATLIYTSGTTGLGLEGAAILLSGAAPIAPEVLEFFMALGET
jgi:long-subunit acyl-CoA synthetase (AMP-forming)